MKRSLLALIAIVVVLGVAGLMVANQDDETATQTPQSNQITNQADTDTATPTGNQTAPEQGGTNPSQTIQNTVTIRDFSFGPATLTVKKGTTVTWTNEDSTQHDVTPDSPTGEFKRSSLLSKGDTYSVTFNTPGTYRYHCTPHPDMKGTITVTE